MRPRRPNAMMIGYHNKMPPRFRPSGNLWSTPVTEGGSRDGDIYFENAQGLHPPSRREYIAWEVETSSTSIRTWRNLLSMAWRPMRWMKRYALPSSSGIKGADSRRFYNLRRKHCRPMRCRRCYVMWTCADANRQSPKIRTAEQRPDRVYPSAEIKTGNQVAGLDWRLQANSPTAQALLIRG